MMQFDELNQKGNTRMSSSKNSKLKTAVLKAGTDTELTDEQARERRIAKRLATAERLTKTTDILAQDKFCVRNQPIPKGKELFPMEWRMQYSDLFYPHAPGGPLYIDMPVTTFDVALCERKIKVLREKGLRYTYLKPTDGHYEGILRLEGQDPDKIKADQRATEVRT
jgi:hypothetical protein